MHIRTFKFDSIFVKTEYDGQNLELDVRALKNFTTKIRGIQNIICYTWAICVFIYSFHTQIRILTFTILIQCYIKHCVSCIKFEHYWIFKEKYYLHMEKGLYANTEGNDDFSSL